MNEPLRKHLVEHYTFSQGHGKHLDKTEFLLEGNTFIRLKNCSKYKCSHCDKTFKEMPVINWRFNKTTNKWRGRCSCRKNFLP